jgi:hypothetical protein
MKPNAPTSADLRQSILTKLADLHTKRQALKASLAPFEVQIAQIQQACVVATAGHVSEIEAMETELKALALADPVGCFGEGRRSVTHGMMVLGLRETTKVGVDGDEKAVKREMVSAWRAHADPKMQVAAALGLTVEYKFNKDAILDNWDVYGDEFAAFGLCVIESDSASITEKKPAKPKAPKAEKVKAIKGASTAEGEGDE